MRIFAAMDIGTNSIRLAVVEAHSAYTWTVLTTQKQVVRLGEGEFAPLKAGRGRSGGKGLHRLTDNAIARGALVCARFAEVARGYGANEIVALATAAVREAANQDEFLDRVRELSGLDVRVISGQEEARLIYLGVSSGVDLPKRKRALFMDIGGGSTELILGTSAAYRFLDSVKLGAVRLTPEFITDPSKPVSPGAWAALQRHILSVLSPAARAVTSYGFDVMYGSSGTIINLAEIAAHAAGGTIPTTFRNYSLALSDLQVLSKRLCSLSIDQRRRVPGINPERADIIIAGAAILQTAMEALGASSIQISDRGLREGIIVDRMLRETYPDTGTGIDTSTGARRRSIAQLMRATAVDDDHAEHIKHLALSLFDQWKRLGLHDYGRSKELLEYAALLHDCGFFVSHTDHQKHSYYLIRNSELLGFNDREVEIIANLALYHRKSPPRRRHANFSRLDAKTQRVIRVLSCALRLAEAMDRSHLKLVSDVECVRDPASKLVRMTLHCSEDAQLEVWAVEGQAEVFEKTFGLPLEVRTTGLALGK